MNTAYASLLVREKRQRERLTLEQAAIESGISVATLCCVQNGKHTPDMKTLYLLSRWLGVRVDELVGQSTPAVMGDMGTVEKIEAALIADSSLSLEAVGRLSELMRTAYNCTKENA